MDRVIKIMNEKAGHKVYILGNKCYRCNHIWVPREIEEKPAVCPACKSPYWDRPKQEKKK
ncbi:MAG: hypothetical protein ABIJ34_03910 [archaeon]